jgi:hypothetical protein
MRRRLRRFGLMAAAGALVLGAVGMPGGWRVPTAHGASAYTLQTEAEYHVDAAARRATVTVTATFTNTTPNPPGSFSTFDVVPFGLQDGASSVTATDGTGRLAVRVSGPAGGRVAGVVLRAPLRYRKSISLRLAYRLLDGAAPQVRIRSTVVVLPVWSFGTSGTVTVRLPAGLPATTTGGTMTAAPVGDEQVFSSGPIADPPTWQALLTATSEATYQTTTRSIALTGGTVDLRVRAWSDDAAWGTRVADLLQIALPALETAVGLPYAGVGPLVITESVPAGSSSLAEPQVGAQEIAIAFDAPPFTVLHQAAHVWIGSGLASERWIREGLASHLAEQVAPALHIQLPYAPAAEAGRLAGGSFPLEVWGTVALNSLQEGWAYAASWAFVDGIAGQLGNVALYRVLQRAAAGVGAYDPDAGTDASAAGRPALALDSRTFLDQLEQVSGSTMGAAFADRVFVPEAAAVIATRAAARSAYAALVGRAGDWGAPDAIRTAMASWNFSTAQQAITAASRWLDDRDRLLAAVEASHLSIPTRLGARWLADGGGAAAGAELRAELAVVAGYREAAAGINDARGPIEALGLVGSPDPRAMLTAAAGLFANGELDAAAAAIQHASDLDAGAQAGGVVRIGILAAVAAVLAAAVVLAARRVRRWATRRALRA